MLLGPESDLLLDFNQFLPEATAQAKARAIAERVEDAATL